MDFFDNEAEESDDEDYAIAQAKKRAVISSDEEEDDEGLDENLEGLIDDNPDLDEGSGSGSDAEDTEKRKHEDSELDEDLSDDDYALIEENLGIKVKRKPHKRKRIKVMSDDEESNQGEPAETLDDQEVIANELFQGDDESEAPPDGEGEHIPEVAPPQEFDLDVSEESDVDDFIVDDEGKPITKKKKHIIHDDKALQEAQDIFGVDFDFEEFEQYGGEYDEEEEEEEEEDAYEEEATEEIGEDGEVVVRPTVKKPKKSKRAAKSTIYDVFEPTELERGFFTDVDQDIRMADLPERFQLRRIKVCPMEEGEMEEEADWIYKWAFSTPPLSQTELSADGQISSFSRRDPSMIGKIQEALKFMRNQQFEVPFIAFYRKEYVEPDLNINDLWKVYHWDEKWMQLRMRKLALIRLMDKMQIWQFDQIDPDQPLDSNFRTLTEEDKIRVKHVECMEELRDVYQHFLLYYGPDIPKMKNAAKERRRRARLEADGEDIQDDEDDEPLDALKQATRKSSYTLCQNAGLADVAQKFGLTPEEFGENLRDNYQRHDVEQDPAEPDELANEFLNGQFKTAGDVLKGAVHMVAMQLGHDPLVRQVVRQVYYERAKIVVRPTKKGMKEIDESHPCYTFKYIINKPIKDITEDMFLKLVMAETDGQLTFKINIDREDPALPDGEMTSAMPSTYFDEIKSLYHRDEFSHLVQEWNNLREEAVKRAFDLILYPSIIKELRVRLLDESKQYVIKLCKDKLYNWLKVAAYTPDHNLDDDDDELDISNGIRIMGVGYSDMRDEAAFAAVIDGDGVVTDYIRLPHLLKRKKTWRQDEREQKQEDLDHIKEFIKGKRPHVIGVGATSRTATRIVEDIKEVVSELEQESDMSPIAVELVDIEMATVFMNSNKGVEDFREYPPLLRQSVSTARRLQDPLLEFCQLCNPDEDILALKFHPLQDHVSKDNLLEGLYLEFINRVNEVGVDVNRCVAIAHMAPLIQFVCGLGPRKGYHLIKTLKQNNSRLENRTQLVTMCHMGPKVFINCAGFIKIDTNSLGDSTEAYVEVLDGSRVHPETYEWARKMAVDALEYDDQAEDANPAGALEEILESPERLKDLDLDAFAEELERQGYGNRHITLYDIRAELNHRYKDLRKAFSPPSIEERFVMLTKETPTSFYCGKLIMGRVTNIAHRKPRGEELDNADPVRNDKTGLWLCPFCRKEDFAELSDVWNHFDTGECPGQSVGVKIRLDNDITGYIPLKNLSDSHVKDPEERVHIGMTLHCRITKIDPERFNIDATCKSSDLTDKENKWKPQLDNYYDFSLAELDRTREEDKQKQQARQTYIKRVIAHPTFQNIDFKTCERLMANLEQGEVIIRPSSKGSDHLTVTLKIADGIHQHIDVQEKGKENAFSLGQSLWIGDEEFEDLDEIIARHIQPIAAFARDILNYKYHMDTSGGKQEIVDLALKEEKSKGPSKIPYFFHATKDYPGKFVLSYLPRKNTIHEYISIVPDGIRYRGTTFHSLSSVIRWFKEHFRDPIPGTPQVMSRTPMRTPMGMSSHQTPTMRSVDPAAIQRAAVNLPTSMYNSLTQVKGGTPVGQYQAAGNYPAGYNTGYNYQQPPPQQTQQATPMMTTPMLTPSFHAQQQAQITPAQQQQPPPHMTTPSHHMGTPQYQLTPRATFTHPGATPTRTPQQHRGSLTPQQQHRSTPQQQHRTTPQEQHRTTPQQQHRTTPQQQHRTTPQQQHRTTPQEQQWTTPQQQHRTTPQQQHRTTPQNNSPAVASSGTPASGTPGSRHSSTPRQSVRTPILRTPQQSIKSTPTPTTATDWAKMAEMWAKQRNEPAPSSKGSTTPQESPPSPRGDATPLFDER